MERFNCKVDDRPKGVVGAQRIKTTDGYVFRLSIESGLVYMHYIQVPSDCWSALTGGPITATSPVLFPLFEQGGE